MTVELIQDRIEDPQEIQAIYARFLDPEDGKITLGELGMIAHLVPGEAIQQYKTELGAQEPDYDKLAEPKFRLYEPVMRELGSIDFEVMDLVNSLPSKPSHVLDVGAGFAPLHKHFKKLDPKIDYVALDASVKTRELALSVNPELNYILHDIRKGLPANLKPLGSNPISVSDWGASYSDARTFVNLVRSLKRAGYKTFINVGLDPERFNVEEVLNTMVEDANKLPEERRRKLQPIIDSIAPNAPAWTMMTRFGASLRNSPLRSQEATAFYLNQAGKVSRTGVLGPKTGYSFFHIVDLTTG